MVYTFSNLEDFFDVQNLSRKYNRPFNEHAAMKTVHLEDGSTKVFFNVIGHKKEDIQVSVTNADFPGRWYLNISAKTVREHLGEFSSQYSIPVRSKIESIDGVVENGLLELTIKWDKTQDPDVMVNIK